MGQSKTQWA